MRKCGRTSALQFSEEALGLLMASLLFLWKLIKQIFVTS